MIKSAALRIRIDPDLHQRFLAICKENDVPAAQVLRQYMRDYVRMNSPTMQGDLFRSDVNEKR